MGRPKLPHDGAHDRGVQWERWLTEHYLSAGGAYGGTPIKFLDATPAELAAAARQEGWSNEDAARSFVESFDPAVVRGWLSGDRSPSRIAGQVPGYFRYLVLTCFVASAGDGTETTNNFRIRLGQILDYGGPFNSVSGVNNLWRSLAGWCDHRREAGDAIRELILPDPTPMHLIGCAVRLAFPAWRDRSAFARILEEIPPARRANPFHLIDDLRRPQRWRHVPKSIRAVGEEFAELLAANRLMLLRHRFWILARSIEASLLDSAARQQAREWCLVARFGGYEGDEIDFELRIGEGQARLDSNGPPPDFSGGLTALLEIPRRNLPRKLTAALEKGILILSEVRGNLWVMEQNAKAKSLGVVLLIDSGVDEKSIGIPVEWRPVEAGWKCSERIAPEAADRIRRLFGEEVEPTPVLVDCRIVEGVRTARGACLGRPAFLPSVEASPTSELSIRALDGAKGLAIAGAAPLWRLEAEAPISGRWILSASDGSMGSDANLILEADVPERSDLADSYEGAGFEAESEIEILRDRQMATSLRLDEEGSSRLDDLLEAVYTGPRAGWSEQHLVPLVQRVMPGVSGVWDVLRALAEAQFIEAYVSTGWRARKWRLVPPTLIAVDRGTALVEGALGTRARKRITAVAAGAGGAVSFGRGVSVLSPSSMVVTEVDVAEFSRLCGLPWKTLTRPEARPAPAAWTKDRRTCDGRILASVWSFERGSFLPPGAPQAKDDGAVIERWTRERGDDRDVFRVAGAGEDIMLSSRTAAILEGYRRRSVPLFRWTKGRLLRTARTGYLPIPIASALRRSAAVASGPLPHSEGGTYAYAVDSSQVKWLTALFGAAIEAPAEVLSPFWASGRVRARRSGGRVDYEDLRGSQIRDFVTRRFS